MEQTKIMYIVMHGLDSSIIGFYNSKTEAWKDIKKLGLTIYDVDIDEYEVLN